MSSPPESDHPKILVLVLGVEREPWSTIEELGQRRTWSGVKDLPNLVIRYYYGRSACHVRLLARSIPSLMRRLGLSKMRALFLLRLARGTLEVPSRELDGHIIVPVPDTPFTIGIKTLAAFRYVLEHYDFDFLLRTNSSSYVNLKKLNELCATLPRAAFYGGAIVSHGEETFVSGSGILLTRDLVLKIVSDNDFEFSMADDVAMSRSLQRIHVGPSELEIVRLRSVADVADLDESTLGSAHHYRCKIEGDRNQDIRVMSALHERLADVQGG